MVPSVKNTALIFPGISFIQYFPLFTCKQYDVITDLIWIIENVNISKTKNIYLRKKNAILVGFWKAFQISRDYFLCQLYTSTQGLQKVTLYLPKRDLNNKLKQLTASWGLPG